MIDSDVLARIGLVGIAQADTQDQCIHGMVNELTAALTAQGVRVQIVENINEARCWAALVEAGASSVVCHGIAMSQALQFHPFLHGMNVLFNCLDHPVYWAGVYKGFASRHGGRLVCTYPTTTNLACALNMVGEHDARLLRHSAVPRVTAPLREREAAVVFAGNFTPAAEVRAKLAAVSAGLLPLFDEAVTRLETGEAATLEDAVSPGFTDIHGSQRDTFVRLCQHVDRYVRSDVRERIVRSLKGLPVHLFGSGWDCLDLPPNVRRYGSCDASAVSAANGQARLVINSTPRYYESHERMFEAAAAGAGLITARNPYTQATFGRCAELFDAPEQAGELCARLLADRGRLEEFGARGIALIRDREGWPHRAEEIVRMLDPVHVPGDKAHRAESVTSRARSRNSQADAETLSRIGLVAIPQANTNDQCIHRMVDEVVAALTAKGVRTMIIEHPRAPENWAVLPKAGVSTVLCYGIAMSQALCALPHLRGMNLLFACLDHPIYWCDLYHHLAQRHQGRAVFTYNTASNLAGALTLCGEHDARLLRHSAALRDTRPLAEREAAVVFSGNFKPPSQVRAEMVETLPWLRPLFEQAVALLQSGEVETLEDAVTPGFTDLHGAQRDTFVQLCQHVDRYVRSDMRERVVRSLRDVPVHLFGSGWDTLDLPGNVRLYGSRDVSEVQAANARARIVVNSVPYYYESHERMFEAAAVGAGLITARTAYAQATFGRCAEFFDSPDTVGELCARLLRDPGRLEEMGAAGKELIRESEGWPHRVDEIIRMLDPLHRPDQGPELRPMAQCSRIECDLALDLRDLASLDLDLKRLQSAATIRLAVAPDGLDRIVQLLAQTGGYLSEGTRVVAVLEMLVPPGGFIGLGDALDRLGFSTLDVSLGMGQSSLTVVKTAELAEPDRACALYAFRRRISLAFPTTRDPQRLAAIHYKAFDRPEMLAALDRAAARPGLFLDLDAGAGSHAIYVAGVLGREVMAVERDPARLACLRANVETCRLGHLIRIREEADTLDEPVALVKWAGGAIDSTLLDAQAPPVIVIGESAADRLAPHGYARDDADTTVPIYVPHGIGKRESVCETDSK